MNCQINDHRSMKGKRWTLSQEKNNATQCLTFPYTTRHISIQQLKPQTGPTVHQRRRVMDGYFTPFTFFLTIFFPHLPSPLPLPGSLATGDSLKFHICSTALGSQDPTPCAQADWACNQLYRGGSRGLQSHLPQY